MKLSNGGDRAVSTVPQVRAFRDWIKQEVAALDWAPIRGKAQHSPA